MRLLSLALCAGVLGSLVWGQSTPDVGSGAPTTSIQQQFQTAYFRNGFAYQVSLPPLGDVKRVYSESNKYMDKRYPKLDRILKITIRPDSTR